MPFFKAALQILQMAKPAAPSAGNMSLYFKSDGKLYKQDPSGIETGLEGVSAYTSRYSSRYATVSQTLSPTVYLGMKFDGINAESGISYNTSTGAYTIQEAGNYIVTCGIELNADTTANNNRYTRILKNGTVYRRFGPAYPAGTGDPTQVGGSALIPCAVNDVITIEAEQATSNNQTTVADTSHACFCDVYKIP